MISEKLEETRRRLLDLSRRNRLLNHKATATGTLRIVGELPAEVYRILVAESRRMQFLAREEAPAGVDPTALAADGGGDAEPESPHLALAPIEAEPAAGAHLVDTRLQTTLDGEKLQTRLVYLAREATSALEEQGANILYLTLGIVEWREAGSDAVVSRAPLVFVPVELRRKSVNSRHAVSRLDDDVVTNPNLVELCARLFKLDLPLFDQETDLVAYFAQVERAIAAMPGWRLVPEIFVGLFSFAKLLMYRDLDPATWPAERSLTSHPFVRILSGVDDASLLPDVPIPDPATLDDTVPPDECYQVLDADSSQQAAILAAKRGASAVVEGPPGTGKSQTIANIIAECLSEGRTVLFVAEKAAALEVVRRRLETVGLGDFVLELHSRKASKRAVLDEIKRALDADLEARYAVAVDAADLEATRARLNAYVRALHAPVAPLGVSPFEGISRAVALADAPAASCLLPDVLAWTPAAFAASRDAVESLDRRLARVGDPAAHPWRGAGLTAAGLEAQQRIGERSLAFGEAIGGLERAGGALAAELSARAPETPCDVSRLITAAETLLAAPDIPPSAAADARWDAPDPGLAKWLRAGAERMRYRERWSRVFTLEAERRDFRELLDRRRRQAGSWLRFLTPSWYGDGRLLKSYFVADAAPETADAIDALSALVESAALRAEIERDEREFAARFGHAWEGIDGDWSRLERFAAEAEAVRRVVLSGAVPEAAASRALDPARRAAIEHAVADAAAALDRAAEASASWLDAIRSDDARWHGGAWAETRLAEAASRLRSAMAELDRLQDWADFEAILAETAERPVRPFVDWALTAEGLAARDHLARAFERRFYSLWTDKALEADAALARFRGEEHELLVERFRRLDAEWLETSKRRLADLVRSKQPDMSRATTRQSKLGVVQGEIRKQRNIMPLRKLFSTAGDVIQAIKPCFMMSPISVAQYLAPGAIEFDLVVFDEASQVEPADAYGAIARGRQLLLVGDERQLPPTNFFSKIEEEDSSGGDGDLAVGDLESVLALGAVRLPRRCRLRWHYRSRHESLIEFSNEQFYADAPLRIFPSPHTGRDELGLAFRFVEGGVYKRGAGQHNPVEAAEVAAEVMRHATERPELSLGVGAFSISQQRAIQDELERLRREASDDRVERFFAAHPEEPFFVKNLETIQGDERDVILLSVGYGPDDAGRLTMNFGPLNRDGGWRRLNVLVTRARQRCVLFSSFRADQMNLGGTQARGVVALKEYLYYAEHGRMTSTGTSTGRHDSPFEADVCRALRERGWEVHAQVGAAGFAIDLAVVDPERPGRYLLGVECDGATYHSSATARDRDRLRQAVLEGLGWTLYRIWSTDWFHRREQVLDRLLARLEQIRRGEWVAPPPSVPEPPSVMVRAVAPPPTDPGTVRYVRTGRVYGTLDELAHMRADAVATIIADIVREEGPIHEDEAIRVLGARFGTRASKRVQEAFHLGVQYALRTELIARRGAFFWEQNGDGVRVRRRDEGCPVTKPELIAPEEFRAAVRVTLEREFGLKRDALVPSTARTLGYSRLGTAIEAAIATAVEELIEEGAVVEDSNGFLVAG